MKESEVIKITLDVFERMVITNLLGTLRGPLTLIRQGLKALDIFELKPEERIEVGFQVIPPNRITWREGKEWELEVPQDVWDFIKLVMGAPDAELPLDRKMEGLLEKLGLGEE